MRFRNVYGLFCNCKKFIFLPLPLFCKAIVFFSDCFSRNLKKGRIIERLLDISQQYVIKAKMAGKFKFSQLLPGSAKQYIYFSKSETPLNLYGFNKKSIGTKIQFACPAVQLFFSFNYMINESVLFCQILKKQNKIFKIGINATSWI